MKRTILLIAISVIAFKSQAQTEAGKFLLGGSGVFNSSNDDNSSLRAILIAPQVGYFVKKNLAIGVYAGYQLQRLKFEDPSNIGIPNSYTTKTNTFFVSPFARYYTNITEQFRFFGQLSVPISFSNVKNGDVNGNNYVKQSSDRNFAGTLSPGFAFFPGGGKVSFEFSVIGLSYNHWTRTIDNPGTGVSYNGNKTSSNQFVIGGNLLAPNIGVYFYL